MARSGGGALLIATQPHHVFFCCGFRSALYDTDPHLRMAVLFNDRDVVVIGHKADAWSAIAVLPEECVYIPYGRFHFDAPAHPSIGNDHGRFEQALATGLRQLAGRSCNVMTDSNDAFCDGLLKMGFQPQGRGLPLFTEIRAVKQETEIGLLRQASALTERALRNALANLKAGDTELDVEAAITAEIIRSGARPGFAVVTSGERSALVDCYSSPRPIAGRDILRIDVGCTFHGYWSDTARTAFVGDPSAEVISAFHAISAGDSHARASVRPGVKASDLFHETVATVRHSGLPDFQRHHVGHGLGLEAHEFPTLGPDTTELLAEGMVINVEVPYYRPGWGGMMTEDTLLVTRHGNESLTSLDRQLYIIAA